MKYAVEIGSGAMMYVPSFIKTGSGIQKLMGRIHIQTHRQHGDLISLLLFSQNRGNRLKIRNISMKRKMFCPEHCRGIGKNIQKMFKRKSVRKCCAVLSVSLCKLRMS
jgi:hypothetical protein